MKYFWSQSEFRPREAIKSRKRPRKLHPNSSQVGTAMVKVMTPTGVLYLNHIQRMGYM